MKLAKCGHGKHWAKGLCRKCYTRWYRKEHAQTIADTAKHHPNKTENYRRWHRKYKYGVTPEEVEVLVVRQNGKCALPFCNKMIAWTGPGGFSIDHDHETGQIRGILCTSHNVAIGALGDCPETIIQVLEYLNATR